MTPQIHPPLTSPPETAARTRGQPLSAPHSPHIFSASLPACPHLPENPTSRPPSRLPSLSASLAIVTLAATLLARILVAAGSPTAFNFAHFFLLAISLVIVLPHTRSRLAANLLTLLLCLAAVIAASALLNGAGLINLILEFLLLAEPFLLLLLIIESPWSSAAVRRFRAAALLLFSLHLVVAFYQRLLLGYIDDQVRGLFINQVAGAHVAGAVALAGGLYFALSGQPRSLSARLLLLLSSATVLAFADAKQVLAASLAALIMLLLLRCRQLRSAAHYLLVTVAASAAIALAAHTLFPSLMVAANIEVLQTGLRNKLHVFPLLAEQCHDTPQLLLGLGPGHTIGRLGWLLPDYAHALLPLGATTSPTTQLIILANNDNWVSSVQHGSSMWSMLFSWAGILGDLGLAGAAVYALLWLCVIATICTTDLARFLVLSTLALGCIFAWLEEPAYTLFVAALIGLHWQEHHQIPNPQPQPA